MTVLGVNNGERLPAIDSQSAFENALRRALEMDEPLQGVLCNNLTVTGENLCRLEALQICLERCRFETAIFPKPVFTMRAWLIAIFPTAPFQIAIGNAASGLAAG